MILRTFLIIVCTLLVAGCGTSPKNSAGLLKCDGFYFKRFDRKSIVPSHWVYIRFFGDGKIAMFSSKEAPDSFKKDLYFKMVPLGQASSTLEGNNISFYIPGSPPFQESDGIEFTGNAYGDTIDLQYQTKIMSKPSEIDTYEFKKVRAEQNGPAPDGA